MIPAATHEIIARLGYSLLRRMSFKWNRRNAIRNRSV